LVCDVKRLPASDACEPYEPVIMIVGRRAATATPIRAVAAA